MDLIVSALPQNQVDPVVVVIPIKWMRPIIEKYPVAFKILINNLVGYGQFDTYGLDKTVYTNSNAAEYASTDEIMGWARATKDMILQHQPDGKSWDFVRKNTPLTVMMGFDMEIGGDGEGDDFIELIKDLPEDVDNLVIPLHYGKEGVTGLLSFLGSNHLDNEKTLRLEGGSDDFSAISMGPVIIDSVNDWIDNFTMLPKGLYKIMTLSDMDLRGIKKFYATINYRKLKI